jgi:hypothetical protein
MNDSLSTQTLRWSQGAHERPSAGPRDLLKSRALPEVAPTKVQFVSVGIWALVEMSTCHKGLSQPRGGWRFKFTCSEWFMKQRSFSRLDSAQFAFLIVIVVALVGATVGNGRPGQGDVSRSGGDPCEGCTTSRRGSGRIGEDGRSSASATSHPFGKPATSSQLFGESNRAGYPTSGFSVRAPSVQPMADFPADGRTGGSGGGPTSGGLRQYQER